MPGILCLAVLDTGNLAISCQLIKLASSAASAFYPTCVQETRVTYDGNSSNLCGDVD